MPKLKDSDREKLLRKREKQKVKDDTKLEKRRLKEEKLRKTADKEKDRDKKKQQKLKQKSSSSSGGPSKIADFIQVHNYIIPHYNALYIVMYLSFSPTKTMFLYS